MTCGEGVWVRFGDVHISCQVSEGGWRREGEKYKNKKEGFLKG